LILRQPLSSTLFPYTTLFRSGLPIIILDDQVSVGGQTFSTVGNKIADFLHRSPQTDNITLIEIKTPKTKLLGTEYRRKVFSPASDRKSTRLNSSHSQISYAVF